LAIIKRRSKVKKTSYENKKIEHIRPADFVFRQNKDYSTEPAGRNGFVAQEMSYDADGVDSKIYAADDIPSTDFEIDESLLQKLLCLGDDLDECELYEEASFSDFLIEKFSSAIMKKTDYVNEFNKLCQKIYFSEILDSSKIVKDLAVKFSRIIRFEVNRGKDKDDAEMIAYNRIVIKAKNIIGVK